MGIEMTRGVSVMDTMNVYHCSRGCRNCPRVRGCIPGSAIPIQVPVPIEGLAGPVTEPVPSAPNDTVTVPRTAAEPVPAPVEAATATATATGPVTEPEPETIPVSGEIPSGLEPAAGPEPAAEPSPAVHSDAPEPNGTGLPALDTPAVPDSEMDAYLEKNCEQGVLRVQAFQGRQAIPIEGVAVTVRCPIGGDQMIFFQGQTDSSGVIDPILLPAPKPETSLSPGQDGPCSEYEVVAEHPSFDTLTTHIMVFPGIKTIQPLQMRLKAV